MQNLGEAANFLAYSPASDFYCARNWHKLITCSRRSHALSLASRLLEEAEKYSVFVLGRTHAIEKVASAHAAELALASLLLPCRERRQACVEMQKYARAEWTTSALNVMSSNGPTTTFVRAEERYRDQLVRSERPFATIELLACETKRLLAKQKIAPALKMSARANRKLN